MDENTTKSIIKEIIRECTHREMEVSETFISYYVHLLVMDPAWELMSDLYYIEREALQKFIAYVVSQLQYEKCPCMMVLRMQKYIMCNFDNKKNKAAKQYREQLRSKLFPLERDILQMDTDTVDELENNYKKIVYFITLLSGMGNPSMPMVYKEVQTALGSIFNPVSDGVELLFSTEAEKENELQDLTELTAGIRLFNRDCKKGGKGIEDLPKVMMSSLEITRKELELNLIETMNYINLLTSAVDSCFRTEKKTEGFYMVCEIPKGLDHEDVKYAKDMLVFRRQYEIYLRKFLIYTDYMEKTFNTLLKEFNAALDQVHDICRFRTAIPVNLVYPHFKELYKIWKSMQDEIIQLANLNQIFLNVQNLSKDFDDNSKQLHKMLRNNPILTDAQRLELTPLLTIQLMKQRGSLLDPETISNFQQIPLQYIGFCAWKFVELHGGLIPGNPNMGVARVNGKYYVFSSLEAGIEFNRQPERYIAEGLLILRQKPELINLLQMKDFVARKKFVKGLKFESRDLLIAKNVNLQTDEHYEPDPEDKYYKWNVWDLRREGMMMAAISRCATCQTTTFNKSQVMSTQTWGKHEVNQQTKTDNYSNVPTLSNYIFGLRGRKDDQQFVIELTRPVAE